MRMYSLVLVPLLSLVAASFGTQRQAITINTATPEGRLLQQVKEESGDTKKAALMEQFLNQYPQHEGAVWIYSQMVTSCAKAGQFEKAFASAEKVLAQDPADVQTAYAAVEAAGMTKNPDTVRRWAVMSSEIARKTAQKPKTGDEDDDAFKQRVDSARRVSAYTEYALFNSAVQTPEAAKKVELFRTLETQAPDSTYLTQGYGLYFQALIQSGDLPAAVVLAEKLIAQGKANEEMLGTAGDFYLRQNREPQKVLDYSAKLFALAGNRSKPDGVSDADWQKWRNHFLGSARWMEGVVYCVQNRFADSNKVLREALPLLEGNDEYKAAALFNLGVANSQLRNVTDAGTFFERCTTINSPYRAMCADNLKRIRSAYRVVK